MNRSSKRTNRLTGRICRGFTVLETVVAATLVIAVLSAAAPMIVRSARIWKQTRNHQLAVDELSSQMDRLIALPTDRRNESLKQLVVSPEVASVLPQATLSATKIDDRDGVHLELSIDWQRTGNAPPIRLVAWVDPITKPDSDTESER